jgi:hypothetical protein
LAIEDTTCVLNHLHIILSYENSSFPDNLKTRAKSKFEETQSLLSEIENRIKTSR